LTAGQSRGRLWAWGLLFPLPTAVLAVVCTSFVGTSFHSPQVGGTTGLAVFALVAGKAWREGPRSFTVFLCGVGAVVVAAGALFLYALAHMGPLG
jgi:hypothetical protein